MSPGNIQEMPQLHISEERLASMRQEAALNSEEASVRAGNENIVEMDLGQFAGYLVARAALELSPQQLDAAARHGEILAEHRAGRVDAYFGIQSQARQAYEDSVDAVKTAQTASDVLWNGVKMSAADARNYDQLGFAAYMQQQQMLQMQLEASKMTEKNKDDDDEEEGSNTVPRDKVLHNASTNKF